MEMKGESPLADFLGAEESQGDTVLGLHQSS